MEKIKIKKIILHTQTMGRLVIVLCIATVLVFAMVAIILPVFLLKTKTTIGISKWTNLQIPSFIECQSWDHVRNIYFNYPNVHLIAGGHNGWYWENASPDDIFLKVTPMNNDKGIKSLTETTVTVDTRVSTEYLREYLAKKHKDTMVLPDSIDDLTIGGVLFAGGVGLKSGRYGMTLDNVKSMTFLTKSGINKVNDFAFDINDKDKLGGIVVNVELYIVKMPYVKIQRKESSLSDFMDQHKHTSLSKPNSLYSTYAIQNNRVIEYFSVPHTQQITLSELNEAMYDTVRMFFRKKCQ